MVRATANFSTPTAPAVVSAAALQNSIRVEPLTCSIGAELSNINLGVASRDPALMAEINTLLLKYRVLFFRDQDITRAEHVAFASHFGELEDHPVAGSDPDHPGLVQIYRGGKAKDDHYENAWHCDATWREKPPMGCVLRCVATPDVGGDMLWCKHGRGLQSISGAHRKTDSWTFALATASRRRLVPQCRSNSA